MGRILGGLVCPFIFFAIHLWFVDESLDTLALQADAGIRNSMEI
jgi:hypothetical protein